MSSGTLEAPIAAGLPPPHPLRELFADFSRNRGAVAGLVIIGALLFIAATANIIAPYSPILTNDSGFLLPPFWQAGGTLSHPLGTDAIGRDMLSRLLFGTRLSLLIGAAVVTLSLLIGTTLGLIAGFSRGIVEIAIMRLMDIILTLPSLLLAIVIVAILGPGLINAHARGRHRLAAALRAHRARRRHHRDGEGLRHRRARSPAPAACG